MLESACTKAAEILTDQAHFVLSADQWEAFNDALERPAKELPNLRKLQTEPSSFDQR